MKCTTQRGRDRGLLLPFYTKLYDRFTEMPPPKLPVAELQFLSDVKAFVKRCTPPHARPDGPWRVYVGQRTTAGQQLKEALRGIATLSLVEVPAEADMLLYSDQSLEKQMLEEQRGELIAVDLTTRSSDMLPFEHHFIQKQRLARLCRNGDAATFPKWHPETFDLSIPEQQAAFVGAYNAMPRLCLNPRSTWIVKPHNLTRGMGCDVTRSTGTVLKSAEESPAMIVQRYVEDPVRLTVRDPTQSGEVLLFDDVKFDLRIYVFVRTLPPASKLGIHHWLGFRLANASYDLSKLHEFEAQFTVMKYHATACKTNAERLSRIPRPHSACVQRELNRCLGGDDTTLDQLYAVQGRIHGVIQELFQKVFTTFQDQVPCNVCAVYGVDIMLSRPSSSGGACDPILLEVSRYPDMTSALQDTAGAIGRDMLEFFTTGAGPTDAITVMELGSA